MQMAPPSRQKSASSAGPSEADIATNEALLRYAEAARSAKSWLKGFSAAGSGSTNDSSHLEEDEEDEREAERERDFLKHKDLYSDTGGIGYDAAAAKSTGPAAEPASKSTATTAFLRKQLLNGSRAQKQTTPTTARYQPQHQQRRRQHDSDGEEESRATVGKNKRRRTEDGDRLQKAATVVLHNEQVESDNTILGDPVPDASNVTGDTHGSEVAEGPQAPSSTSAASTTKPAKKRGTGSYLDELLASRAAKKQKKKNKQTKNPG